MYERGHHRQVRSHSRQLGVFRMTNLTFSIVLACTMMLKCVLECSIKAAGTLQPADWMDTLAPSGLGYSKQHFV